MEVECLKRHVRGGAAGGRAGQGAVSTVSSGGRAERGGV